MDVIYEVHAQLFYGQKPSSTKRVL